MWEKAQNLHAFALAAGNPTIHYFGYSYHYRRVALQSDSRIAQPSHA
jgi:hypothetical protein